MYQLGGGGGGGTYIGFGFQLCLNLIQLCLKSVLGFGDDSNLALCIGGLLEKLSVLRLRLGLGSLKCSNGAFVLSQLQGDKHGEGSHDLRQG